jgi:hypothetical protein
MICIDKAPLEISKASDMRARHSWASETLGRVIAQFGEGAQVITGPHNYTNFESSRTAGQAVYPVARIDGQPIEMTKAKRIWVVIFHDMEVDPRAIDFVPAVASVFEIEFEDAG